MLTICVAVGRSVGLPDNSNAPLVRVALQAGPAVSGTLDKFTEVADRPLFSPARRPVIPPPQKLVAAFVQPVPPPPPPPQPPASHVLAIVIGPDRRAAVLQLTSGKTAVVVEGEHIGEWVLTRVLPDRAILTAREAETTLTFSIHKKSQPTNTAWYGQAGPRRRP
jgi:hypothetical protein